MIGHLYVKWGTCGRSFKTKGSLRNHLTRVHGGHLPASNTIPSSSLTTAPQLQWTDDDYYDTAFIRIRFSSDIVCFDVVRFCAAFPDTTEAVFRRMTKLSHRSEDMTHCCRITVQYVFNSNMSSGEFANYDNRIVRLDIAAGSEQKRKFAMTFTTPQAFRSYWRTYKRISVVTNGWLCAVITLRQCPPNRTGCFTCPLSLIHRLISNGIGPSDPIPFCTELNENGDRIYSTPWNTWIYQSYW